MQSLCSNIEHVSLPCGIIPGITGEGLINFALTKSSLRLFGCQTARMSGLWTYSLNEVCFKMPLPILVSLAYYSTYP